MAAAVLLGLSGCASLPQPCLPPAQPMVSAELMFGRNISDRQGVSEAAFARFAAEEITPRFPDGHTVIDSQGAWRDAARGVTVREPGKLVQIVFRDDPAQRAALTAIAEAYKRRFRQHSVLSVVQTACVGF